MIADHARTDIPAGSYSWKLIFDSVKEGVLQIEDKYRIGRDPDLPRPSAAGSLRRGHRTPYSTEDDHVLAAWMIAHPGEHMGNKNFQELEATVS